MRDIHDRLADLERRVTEMEMRVGTPASPVTTFVPQERDEPLEEDYPEHPTEDWPKPSENNPMDESERRVSTGS